MDALESERRRKERRMQEINDVCEAIRRLWFKHPQQRLGQLLQNYVWEENRPLAMNDMAKPVRDVYYFTDQETLFAVVEALRAAPTQSSRPGWCASDQ